MASNAFRVLDLFCGAGGASAGYVSADAIVVGVDIKPQPNYPFEFIQADALEVMRGTIKDINLDEYDLIHASPPCQRYSKMTKRWGIEETHPDLVGHTRDLLIKTRKSYVIENVPQAPLIDPIFLCGSMFGLGIAGTNWQLRRHRDFETTFYVTQPKCSHKGYAVGVYGNSGGSSKRDGLTFPKTDGWREAMGIDWMTGKELGESIPPAYTEYIANEWKVGRETIQGRYPNGEETVC